MFDKIFDEYYLYIDANTEYLSTLEDKLNQYCFTTLKLSNTAYILVFDTNEISDGILVLIYKIIENIRQDNIKKDIGLVDCIMGKIVDCTNFADIINRK